MALTLTDLQAYTGTTYTNSTKAQAKLDQTVSKVADYLCFPIAVYGFAPKADFRSSTTDDTISVSAVPDGGASIGSITLTKLTTKNASINVLYDSAPQLLTDASPTTTITGLTSGTHTIEYGEFSWSVTIGANDVSILPSDRTTRHQWHVYSYDWLDNVFLEPCNDVYQAVYINHEDEIIESVDDWTFHNHTLRVCKPDSVTKCSDRKVRIAILADWYLPKDVETVIFDVTDSAISTNSSAGSIKKETIGSYSYELFGESTTSLSAHTDTLDIYKICKDVL